MDAGTYNPIISPRGSWRKLFTFTADPALDFTGCEARAEIRDKVEGTELYASINEVVSADGYITIPADETNQIEVFFSATATESLKTAKTAVWDLFVEWPNHEDVNKLLKGKVVIDFSVTEPSHD